MILTIDPSTSATGWAVTQRHGILSTGCLNRPKNSPCWTYAALAMRQGLLRAVAAFPEIDRIICELPEVWGGSSKGRQAALSGSTLKLGFMAGCCAGISPTVPTQYVSVQEWKGQITKAITQARVREYFSGCHETSEHVNDALGIARWYYMATEEREKNAKAKTVSSAGK